MTKLNLKEKLEVIDSDSSWIEETKKEAAEFQVGKSEWAKESGVKNEVVYKKTRAAAGEIMYHVHFCFSDWDQFNLQTTELKEQLAEHELKLDRFGVSIDPSMALPKELRNDHEKHTALYFSDQSDWDRLASVRCSQVHLGDNMIGSPASFDSCVQALKAGITTMGNISQYFGWDYPEFSDNCARTKETVKAILCMGVHRPDGALIHSNLDDGYGESTENVHELLGMALIEKYIVEDLCGAHLAPSFGDDFHSPYKRLIMLSALKQIYGDDLTGSMLFTNKLGRNHDDSSLNDAHLFDSLLFDMAGQAHYRTGHAVTVMADTGLHEKVTVEEIVRKLALAKEEEKYIGDVVKLISFDEIDEVASVQKDNGKHFASAVLDALSSYVDVKNPYSLMLAIKTVGVKDLVLHYSDPNVDKIPTDYHHFEH